MTLWALCFLLLSNIAFASIGTISKMSGNTGAYMMRGTQKKLLSKKLKLEEGDEIFSGDNHVALTLQPSVQLTLKKKTQIKIVNMTSIQFLKGQIRINNSKTDLKLEADGLSVKSQNADFELTQVKENFELDVFKGDVEVSSPLIQTFVPEIVKANEGLSFIKKAPKFERRKLKGKK